MKRLAIYAHYSSSPEVALHVLHCLRHIAALGFQVDFVSNSKLSSASETALHKICGRIIVRENTGFDFCMWQRGLAECDLLQFEELMLLNSSIIGPVQPLAAFWQNMELVDCDFWGLTDSEDFGPHLQTYFLVFHQKVLQSARFRDFWRAVLPYQDKYQAIFSYELGLTRWLEEGGYRWRAAFPQSSLIGAYRSGRSFWRKCRDQYQLLACLYRRRQFPARNTTLLYPDLLLQRGMPFVKASLLQQKSARMSPADVLPLLEEFDLPPEILEELRRNYPVP
jgi:lipopolysaccharide biosynthesis protein